MGYWILGGIILAAMIAMGGKNVFKDGGGGSGNSGGGSGSAGGSSGGNSNNSGGE